MNPFDEDKRLNIINELISTEEIYLQHISKSGLQQLVEFSGNFLQLLQACASRDDFVEDQILGVIDVFSNTMPEMERVYSQYISVGHQQALQSNTWDGQDFSLESQLLRPIQRVLKYPLFLQDLRKNTLELDLIPVLDRVILQMHQCTTRINEVKKARETIAHQQSKPKDILHFVSKTVSRQTQMFKPQTVSDEFVAAIGQKLIGLNASFDKLRAQLLDWHHCYRITIETQLQLVHLVEDLLIIKDGAVETLLVVGRLKASLGELLADDTLRVELNNVQDHIRQGQQMLGQSNNILLQRQKKLLDYERSEEAKDYLVLNEVLVRDGPELFKLMEEYFTRVVLQLIKVQQRVYEKQKNVISQIECHSQPFNWQQLDAVATTFIKRPARRATTAQLDVPVLQKAKRSQSTNDLMMFDSDHSDNDVKPDLEVERLMAMFTQPKYSPVEPFNVVTIYPSTEGLKVAAGESLKVIGLTSDDQYWCQSSKGQEGKVPKNFCHISQ